MHTLSCAYPLLLYPLILYQKLSPDMAWVGAMNSIRNRAEEIILREMIYGEDAA